MRILVVIFFLAAMLTACDENRVYDKNHDFDERFWLASDTTLFLFDISDTTQRYRVYCNVRNSVAYPFSRLFLNYYLEDSTGTLLRKEMVQTHLFDQQTGKPIGTSGLGDIYDQRISLLTNYKFPYKGKYRMWFEQYMRKDTLEGILAIGLRVEKSVE